MNIEANLLLSKFKNICVSFLVLGHFFFFRHARKHFSSFEEDQLEDVQHCMALLAFPTNIGMHLNTSEIHELSYANLSLFFQNYLLTKKFWTRSDGTD